MYITQGSSGYTRDGSQYANGQFLIVVQHHSGTGRELRAFVRSVKLCQSGNWMSGKATIDKTRTIGVSGGFGSDGLPLTLRMFSVVGLKYPDSYKEFTDDERQTIWDQLTPIPQDIVDRYWKSDDGHNSVGSTAPTFRTWAIANLKQLRRPLKLSPYVAPLPVTV